MSSVDRVVFATDLHMSHKNPTSRKDDFSQAMLNKFLQLVNLTGEKGILILGGDVFTSSKVSEHYLCQLMEMCYPLRGRIFSIFGNHDCNRKAKNGKYDSSLGVLFTSKIFTHLDDLMLDGLRVIGYDYDQEIDFPFGHSKTRTVMVVHRFLFEEENGMISNEEVLLKSQVEKLGVSAIFGGHDHSIYPTCKWGKTTIIRPGALSRGTAHGFNLVRDVFCSVLDLSAGTLEYVRIDCQPPEDVFISKDLRMEVVSSRVEEFISLLKKHQSNSGLSLSQMVEEIKMPNEVRSELLRYLSLGGVLLQKTTVDL